MLGFQSTGLRTCRENMGQIAKDSQKDHNNLIKKRALVGSVRFYISAMVMVQLRALLLTTESIEARHRMESMPFCERSFSVLSLQS